MQLTLESLSHAYKIGTMILSSFYRREETEAEVKVAFLKYHRVTDISLAQGPLAQSICS